MKSHHIDVMCAMSYSRIHTTTRVLKMLLKLNYLISDLILFIHKKIGRQNGTFSGNAENSGAFAADVFTAKLKQPNTRDRSLIFSEISPFPAKMAKFREKLVSNRAQWGDKVASAEKVMLG